MDDQSFIRVDDIAKAPGFLRLSPKGGPPAGRAAALPIRKGWKRMEMVWLLSRYMGKPGGWVKPCVDKADDLCYKKRVR